MKALHLFAGAIAAAWFTTSAADWTEARCDIHAARSDHADKTIGCTFSQRQGYITISRADGVSHELSPLGDATGNFRDQDGQPVYRQSGLVDQGLIFRFPEESVYVYWNSAALDPADDDNPAAPFSTRDYDATALVRCRPVGGTAPGSCPAGALRMENGQASVVVSDPDGAQYTINFMTGYVNATNRKADARLEGDTWIVTIDDSVVYEIPLALIEGG